MPSPDTILLDDLQDARLGGAPHGGVREIPAHVLRFHLGHPHDTGRLTGRRALDERPVARQDAVPRLMQERPEGAGYAPKSTRVPVDGITSFLGIAW